MKVQFVAPGGSRLVGLGPVGDRDNMGRNGRQQPGQKNAFWKL